MVDGPEKPQVDKGKQNRNLLFIIGAGVVIGFLALSGVKQPDPPVLQVSTGNTTDNATVPAAATPATTPSAANDYAHTLKNNAMGCRDRDRLDTLIGYLAVGDKATYMSDGQAALDAGDCAELFKGTTVFLEDVPFMKGLMQIRQKGETAKWWVTVESVN